MLNGTQRLTKLSLLINMKKDYNQWYWKVYRWFKWDIKHFHSDVIQGIKNLWKWFPIVWKDRDYDDHFIFQAMKFKIKNTANYVESKKRFLGWEDEVRYMRICQSLIEKIQSSHYQHEYMNFYEVDHNLVPNGMGSYGVTTIVKRDDTEQYILKHPNTKKIVLSNPRYKSYVKSNSGMALAIGIEKHIKARKLLFKILENKIEGWWN